MNANPQTAPQTFSPLRFSAAEADLMSGNEMKHRWIGQLLTDIHRTNARMVQSHQREKRLMA